MHIPNFAKSRERDEGGKFVKLTTPSGFDRKKYCKEYYARNKEKKLLYAREWGRRNKDKRLIIKNRWRAKNKERTNVLTRRYIYRRKNSEGILTFEEEKYIYARFPICPYCNTSKSDTLDHVIPLSKGGKNDTSNVVAVCRSCNSKKHDKMLIEFRPILYLMWNRIKTPLPK